MAKIFCLHWNEAEVKARLAPLVAAGYEVVSHRSTEVHAKRSFVPPRKCRSFWSVPYKQKRLKNNAF
jgi:hypothetical protein